ncbi:methyl-accepting chemotaxis protein [Herbaspirillum sp. GCM10030257]|uniref:methyl-accepting chemotaxis protein n=1 Tax=Herbaspirillum sp. GCM10030257 TaxID=3273393 RepID=UPI0036077B43
MLKNLKVGPRLSLAFCLSSLLVAAVVVFSLIRISTIADAVELQNKVRTEKLEPLYAAREALAQTGLSACNALAISDSAEAARELDKMDVYKAVYLEQLNKLAPQFQASKDFDKVSEGLLMMPAQLNKVRLLRGEATNETLAAFVAAECCPLHNRIVEDMEGLLKSVQEEMNAASASAKEIIESSMSLVIAIGAVLLLAAAGLGIVIMFSITRPLTQAVSFAEAVASGDLTSRIEAVSGDEIGQQGASLKETALSIEELIFAVRQNADNARHANQLAVSASNVAAKGREVVSQVIETMESITESSRKTVDIISMIDGIAFQINILALNAAVEAARAGDKGRGFAVVASEVRRLAHISAHAAGDIKQLINDSMDKIDAGNRLVTEAGSKMEQVVTSVQCVTGIMTQIMMASEQQRSGIEQVSHAMGQMDGATTRQNAALVE